MTKKNTQKTFILLAIITFAVGGCWYTASKPSWIEWEEHNPQLHGQTIIFNVPMVYVDIKSNTNDTYRAQERAIGRLIMTEESFSCRGCYKSIGYKAQEIEETEFKIIKSYWQRLNWWDKAFANELRQLVLEDSQGNQSILYPWGLKDSNRPELEFEGS